ncbi:hypothetical protein NP233_g4497 [Leucocoprinus birnbaumii]|uniref:F-box domain-containing protein n=1 Tax=Leucocoprinus birnbaumii TaxID=56174 RepID=A0AAD5YVG3_9AGAR|nr:hypothetical protein NP233_g4497 [Leucocoprinus birnbaumii]
MAQSQTPHTRSLSSSSTVAPIVDHLPAEILAEIFSTEPPACIELPPVSSASDSTDFRIPSPWSLASVCRRWRDVVFSTPYLWSILYIRMKLPPHPSLIPTLQLFLERSGNHPLTFVLRAGGEVRQTIFPQVLACLVKRARQWEVVSLAFNLKLFNECAYLQDPDICFPRLRALKIASWPHICLNNLQPPPYKILTRAPLLSELALEGFSYYPLTLHLPWDQITYLSMKHNDAGVEWLLDILEHTPNLCVLTFDACEPDGQWQSKKHGDRLIVLSHLQELDWSCRAMWDYSSFFNHVSAPHLRFFNLLCHENEWHQDPIRAFLQRSSCSVTYAKLHTATLNYLGELRPYFGMFPDVKVLSLSAAFNRSELQELTVSGEASEMTQFPKLQTLDLHESHNMVREKDYSAFVEVVKSRLRGPEGLGGGGGVAKLECLQIFTYGSDETSKLYEVLRQNLSPDDLKFVHQEFVRN